MVSEDGKKKDDGLVLRVEVLRRGDVRELRNALYALENFYNHICFFDIIVQAVNREMSLDDLEAPNLSATFQRLAAVENVESFILPEERLELVRISIQSPGFLDVIGKLNPLETLRKYISDCHDRRKDRDFRNDADAERMWIANRKEKLKLMKDEVKLFRDIGLPDEYVRQVVLRNLVEPSDMVDRAQDSGFMVGARLTSDPPNRNLLGYTEVHQDSPEG